MGSDTDGEELGTPEACWRGIEAEGRRRRQRKKAKAISRIIKRTGKSRRWVYATLGRMKAAGMPEDRAKYPWLWDIEESLK